MIASVLLAPSLCAPVPAPRRTLRDQGDCNVTYRIRPAVTLYSVFYSWVLSAVTDSTNPTVNYPRVKSPGKYLQVNSPGKYPHVKSPSKYLQVKSPGNYLQAKSPGNYLQVKSPVNYVLVKPLFYLLAGSS